MRTFFWVLGLFAVATGLVVAARFNAGYVLVALENHRVDLSLNFAVLLLAALFAACYALIRAVSSVLALPTAARRFHESRRRERGADAFRLALRAWLEGRPGKAERAATEAAELGESPVLSTVIAARAAHQRRAFEARDLHLAAIDEADPADAYLKRVTQAELLLEERRHLDALAALGRIAEKHGAALRLELKARRLARDWDGVEALLPQLERLGEQDAAVARLWRRTATAEVLKRRQDDAGQLADAWERVPAELRVEPTLARIAAGGFARLGHGREAGTIIEAALEVEWDGTLALLYAASVADDAVARIQRAEAWLPRHPRDAGLLLALGRLCTRAALWGKARTYFEASLAVEPGHAAHLELAHLCAVAGQTEQAARHREQALALAVARLDALEGAAASPV